MTDILRHRNIISAMYLDIITGDIHIRHQYIQLLLSHITTYLKEEKIRKYQTPISQFRTRLHHTISMVLHTTHPLPAWDTKREEEIRRLENYFRRFVIRIDENVADDVGMEQIEILDDMETIEMCRNVCYSATGDYSLMMSGNPEGLTQATNKYAYVLNLITPIIFHYDIIDISEADYANAARAASKRINELKESVK